MNLDHPSAICWIFGQSVTMGDDNLRRKLSRRKKESANGNDLDPGFEGRAVWFRARQGIVARAGLDSGEWTMTMPLVWRRMVVSDRLKSKADLVCI